MKKPDEIVYSVAIITSGDKRQGKQAQNRFSETGMWVKNLPKCVLILFTFIGLARSLAKQIDVFLW